MTEPDFVNAQHQADSKLSSLPHAHAQRGKVIGSVVVVVVVVVSTKIARSRILGEFTSAKLIVVKVSEIERKRAYVRQGCPKGTTKAINRAFYWSRVGNVHNG